MSGNGGSMETQWTDAKIVAAGGKRLGPTRCDHCGAACVEYSIPLGVYYGSVVRYGATAPVYTYLTVTGTTEAAGEGASS